MLTIPPVIVYSLKIASSRQWLCMWRGIYWHEPSNDSTVPASAAESRAMYAPGVLIFTLLAVSSHADAAKILGLFPHTGKSHQMVFEPLLRTLAERGHHVTVVSFFPLKNPPQNYTDVSLEGVAPIGVETFDIKFLEDAPVLTKYLGVDKMLEQIMNFHPLADMATGVCEKLVELPALKETLKKQYDVVFVENFNSDCMLGLLHIYGVTAPKIALISSNLMPWSGERIGLVDNPSYSPTVSSSFTDVMTFPERVENTVMFYYLNFFMKNYIQAKEGEIIERRFGKKVDLSVLAKNMSLMFVNTFIGLNGVRPSVPGLIEVGGMHLDPIRKPIPQYMQRFLNESEEGVILFSWGSLIKTATIPPYKEQILVNVLSKLPQRVIWKYEGSGPEGNLTGNILRVNWIPQYELLQHKKVIAFVAHGGLLGMTEAVSAGKPMVVVPFFGDQPCNGAAATAAGLATTVRYADLTEDSFGNALKKVLSAQMRVSARQASKIWRDRLNDPLETAVYWTERVARWGHASKLHAQARDMPFYQIALLDVLAALLLGVLLLLLVLWWSVKLALYLLGALLVKESKKKKVH